MIRAGRLHRLITIQKPDPLAAQDSHGFRPLNWQTVCQVWAEMRALSGNESIAAGVQGGTATYAIKIRYRAGLDCTMRATWGSRSFGFIAVLDPDERRRELIITAVELTG